MAHGKPSKKLAKSGAASHPLKGGYLVWVQCGQIHPCWLLVGMLQQGRQTLLFEAEKKIKKVFVPQGY